MNRDLIEKYYQGKCTPQEVEQVLEWFKGENPGNIQEQDLLAMWQQAESFKADAAHQQKSQQRWQEIQHQLQSKAQEPYRGAVERKIQVPVWTRVMQVAAVFILLMGAVGVWIYQASQQTPEAALQFVTSIAKPGVKKTIHLEDGSTIYLNGGSSVTYPVHFAANRRDITLKGEAFFEVAKDKERPFTVQSGIILTQALGTSFNISYKPEDGTVSVALATGKVRIDKHVPAQKNAKQIGLLVPGQQLVYDQRKQVHHIEPFSVRDVLGWKDGILNFKKANLQQVIGKLENWYGVVIEIAPDHHLKTNEWHYTGEYQNQSIEEVLEGIGFVKNFSFKRESGKIRIEFNHS